MSILEMQIQYSGEAWKTATGTSLGITYDRSSGDDLDKEIESARERILNLSDNWDGEGSPGYLRSTLDRAINFLITHSSGFSEVSGRNAPVPQINPAPGGSIDIHWKQASWELLVNIPAAIDQKAAFYGDDYGKGTIKGTLDLDRYNFGLLEWLMK
jgi:hypothetical protein